MDTSTIIIVILAVAVVLAIAVAIWFYMQRRQTNQLRSKFGPEYNRAIRSEGDTKHAEQVLAERQNRVEKLNIRVLSASERNDFAQAWEQEQARFVDEPTTAVKNADRLVQRVMKARGYPVSDFEQRVADVSVDHPVVVQNYRVAHDIAARGQNEDVSTEELREAMIHYRALFADLLHDGGVRPVREVVVRGDNNTKARGAVR
jgi:FtsZ-interacting cell division protein ZipA